jgi:sodium transport system permease protein
MVAIALLAKSFKEAQSYLTPLVMAAVFPLVIGMLPGLQLTPVLALIPLFNVCQLIKEIFLGEFTHLAFAITMAANVVYAGVAFWAAVRVFSNERVLFRT